jgi:hypothetical protein
MDTLSQEPLRLSRVKALTGALLASFAIAAAVQVATPDSALGQRHIKSQYCQDLIASMEFHQWIGAKEVVEILVDHYRAVCVEPLPPTWV